MAEPALVVLVNTRDSLRIASILSILEQELHIAVNVPTEDNLHWLPCSAGEALPCDPWSWLCLTPDFAMERAAQAPFCAHWNFECWFKEGSEQ